MVGVLRGIELRCGAVCCGHGGLVACLERGDARVRLAERACAAIDDLFFGHLVDAVVVSGLVKLAFGKGDLPNLIVIGFSIHHGCTH